jgi:hypothetical protein
MSSSTVIGRLTALAALRNMSVVEIENTLTDAPGSVYEVQDNAFQIFPFYSDYKLFDGTSLVKWSAIYFTSHYSYQSGYDVTDHELGDFLTPEQAMAAILHSELDCEVESVMEGFYKNTDENTHNAPLPRSLRQRQRCRERREVRYTLSKCCNDM